MRVRVVLTLALMVVVGALVLDMSGRAPRTAGSDHVGPSVFAATIPGGGRLCQRISAMPQDAARVQLVIGTYGHPVPVLSLRFTGVNGEVVATGRLPADAREGPVTIPLTDLSRSKVSTNVCLHIGGKFTMVVAGEGGPVSADSELVNGKPQPGRISLLYFRRGEESWWQLLPTLSARFAFGKTPVLGEWALPLAALMLLGVWIVTVRLLLRETQ